MYTYIHLCMLFSATEHIYYNVYRFVFRCIIIYNIYNM